MVAVRILICFLLLSMTILAWIDGIIITETIG